MGEMITKPDANPILLAVLNWIIGGLPIGYFMMGQKKKAIIATVIIVLSWCLGLGYLFALVFAYDAYLLGQKLAAGESIGETQNGLEFLNMIFK